MTKNKAKITYFDSITCAEFSEVMACLVSEAKQSELQQFLSLEEKQRFRLRATETVTQLLALARTQKSH